MSGFLYYVGGVDEVPGAEALPGLGLGHLCGAGLLGLEVERPALDGAARRGSAARGVLLGLGEQVRLSSLRFDGAAQDWVCLKRMDGHGAAQRQPGGARSHPAAAGEGTEGGEEEHPPPFGHPLQRGTKPEEDAVQEHGAPCEVWVGCPRVVRPGPLDLVRPSVLDSSAVVLGDGNKWRVPVARAYTVDAAGECTGVEVRLPSRSRLDYATGRWMPGGIAPDYVALWEIAMRWLGALEGAREEEEAAGYCGTPLGDEAVAVPERRRYVFDFSGGHEAAVTVLAANYRVGPAEVDLLGLLGTEEVKRIMWALCGMDAYDRVVKKKACAKASRPSCGA